MIKENTVTTKVRELLSRMTHGWTFREQQAAFVGNQRTPDIIAMRDGRETVAIEAKAHNKDIADAVDELQTDYFGQRLKPLYQRVSPTLTAGLALRYPKAVQDIDDDDLEHALVHTDAIDYCVVTADGEGNFPKSGYATGSLRDIATALHIGASPTKKIAEVAEVYSEGMEEWSKDIERSIQVRPVIGDMLAEILGQEATEEACKMACMFVIDAFIFQNAVAGKDGFEEVRGLEHYDDDAQINYKGIIANWVRILKVNYVPIFNDAVALVKVMREYDVAMARRVLKGLLQTANEICQSHLAQVQEIGGELFQKLVVDRDYVKAHYTLPESAALLSALVCPDIDVDNLPKVADYACGTGALVNGVYKRIQSLYERKTGKSSQEIHRVMVENNLGASDIYPHTTHLTFTAMAATHPTTTLGKTRVITAPYGIQDDESYKIGSLELLDTKQLDLRTMGTLAAQIIGDDDIATVDYKREFPDDEMDIVIMNPPFSRPGANNGRRNAYSTFQSSSHEDDVQAELQRRLNNMPTRFYSAKAGFAAAFVEMADCKLKEGGCAGFILPQTMMTALSWNTVRNLFATEYHNVIVVTLSSHRALDMAFSHDTGMAECMVVATKGVDVAASIPTGRARFVCLNSRPDSLLSAEMIASKIRSADGSRRLDGAPNGGDELYIGAGNFGRMLDAPIDEREWVVARANSLSLLQTAYNLSVGRLHLPQMRTGHSVPMAKIGDVGIVGYNHAKIKSPKTGAFEMHPRQAATQDGYDALWQSHAQSQRAMTAHPDFKAQIRIGKEKSADDVLRRTSRTHFHMNPKYSSSSMLASYTEKPAIGVCSLTDVKLANPTHDSVWTLWANSTLGLLCHWLNAGKQQEGRARYNDSQIINVPTLDVRQLTDNQLAAADRIFADLKAVRMLPYNECAWDEWRHVLDARLLSEVLDITDRETQEAMQNLREMLCAEPTIAGTKKSTCDLEAERAKFDLGGCPVADKRALDAQQARLRQRGIYLP